MSGTASEITEGMRVQFFDGNRNGDLIEGVVNGRPWVFFDGIDAVARIPVFVPSTGAIVDIGGGNVYRVGIEPASVKA